MSIRSYFRMWNSYLAVGDDYSEHWRYGRIHYWVWAEPARADMYLAAVTVYQSAGSDDKTEEPVVDTTKVMDSIKYIAINQIDAPVVFAPVAPDSSPHRYLALIAMSEYI